eukprot:CAMPEP_0196232330 /NCGR_PEP_ID=MMETSP0913-20130531/2973_1 /TAXON_ID=49265 /ORGANISM="Thalassiosira rotula, Strain GSO102" /LENGTH=50 /DNA_ID=CAMNT_0041512785 /DNA_START=49 /DNA_END=201 /DNA_ORIENTATION=-
MEDILKVLDKLPYSVKILVTALLGLQGLAFGAWFVMMLREGSKEEKEKQS